MFTEQQLGDRIKQARTEADLRQEEFAEKIDVVVQQVSRYENGRDFPTIRRLLRIAEVTGRDISWFFLEDNQRIEDGERPITPQEALAVLARHIESDESSLPTSASVEKAPGESRLEGVQKGTFGRRGKRTGKSERKRDHG